MPIELNFVNLLIAGGFLIAIKEISQITISTFKTRTSYDDSPFLEMVKKGGLQRGDMFIEDFRDHPEATGDMFTHVILENNTEEKYIKHTLLYSLDMDDWDGQGEIPVKLTTNPETDSYQCLRRREQEILQRKGIRHFRPKPQAHLTFKSYANKNERTFTHSIERPDLEIIDNRDKL